MLAVLARRRTLAYARWSAGGVRGWPASQQGFGRALQTQRQALDLAAENHDLLATFRAIKRASHEREGRTTVKVSREMYSDALSCLAQYGLTSEFMALLEEMAEQNISMTREVYHHILKLCNLNGLVRLREETLKDMKLRGFEYNAQTYEFLIEGKCLDDQIEWALSLLAEMKSLKLSPTPRTFDIMITHCSLISELDLCKDLLEQRRTMGILPEQVYLRVMRMAAQKHNIDLVRYLWQLSYTFYLSNLDEGCFINILHTCAQAGETTIATACIKIFAEMSIPLREWHLVPLVEAFIRSDDLEGAINMLHVMRENGVEPQLKSVDCIARVMAVQGADYIDQAYYRLDKLSKDGKTIDALAWNAIIKASIAIGDLGRALVTYEEAVKLGFSPVIETFNFLLDGCRLLNSSEPVSAIVSEMQKRGIEMNVESYEELISLDLRAGNIDAAFDRLEFMRSRTPLTPSYRIYHMLILKCLAVNDKRYRLCLDDTKTFGLTLEPFLIAAIKERGTNDDVQNATQSRRREPRPRADNSAEGRFSRKRGSFPRRYRDTSQYLEQASRFDSNEAEAQEESHSGRSFRREARQKHPMRPHQGYGEAGGRHQKVEVDHVV